MAVLFVGVAASSSFRHESELSLSPGQTTTRRELPRHLRAPDGERAAQPDKNHTGAILELGAVLNVTTKGRHVTTLNPSRGYYDTTDPTQGSVGHLIGGEAVSHVGLDAGAAARLLERDRAEHQPAPRCRRSINAGNRRSPTRDRTRASSRSPCLARQYLRPAAAGAVPLPGLAAGHLDLAGWVDRASPGPWSRSGRHPTPCAGGVGARAVARAERGLARA